MPGGSNGYRAALVRRQLTPGRTSSLPGTAGLPPFIFFSTRDAELDSASYPQLRNLEETTMTDQSKPYTPLTTDNSALVLVDHQVGLMTGVRDYETGELKHNVVALARAAKVLR